MGTRLNVKNLLTLTTILLSLLGSAPRAQADSKILFGQNLMDAPQVWGDLERNSSVHVSYDTYRMHDIVGTVMAQQRGYGYGSFSDVSEAYATAFHCYGYGCCDFKYPGLRLRYRLRGWENQFATINMTEGQDALLFIPSDADFVEMYFEIDSYRLDTQYCGSGSVYTRIIPFNAFDSKFGANFQFGVR